MELIAMLIAKYPIAAQVFMIMGVLRAINKPLFALLQSYVDATASKSDNELLAKIMASKVYKYLNFILDWSTSVKLPKADEQPPAK